MNSLGLHLIADLEGCDLSRFVQSEHEVSALKEFISSTLKEGGLQELGNHYHYFGPGAVTAVICLAESHLSFHSWPEYRRVNFDILVCNASGDFRAQAKAIFEKFRDTLFRPEVVRHHELCR